MTELSFAKSFLSTLDSRPIKLQPDYVADPKTFEPKGAYTLPRMPNSMHRSTKTEPIPGSTPAVKITLKSLRNPPLSLSLSSQSPSSSIHELKVAVAKHVSGSAGEVSTDNVRLLYKKKPCADSKTVREILGDDEGGASEIEFSVMIIGGVAANMGQGDEGGGNGEGDMDVDGPPAMVAQGPSGKEVLETEQFWGDLKGFLIQRLRDEGMAEELWCLCREGWKNRGK